MAIIVMESFAYSVLVRKQRALELSWSTSLLFVVKKILTEEKNLFGYSPFNDAFVRYSDNFVLISTSAGLAFSLLSVHITQHANLHTI